MCTQFTTVLTSHTCRVKPLYQNYSHIFLASIIFTSATNIINVVAIQLYFKLRSPTSNSGPVLSNQIPKIRSPNILANFCILAGAIIRLLNMLWGDLEESKYSIHLTVAVGVRTK